VRRGSFTLSLLFLLRKEDGREEVERKESRGEEGGLQGGDIGREEIEGASG